MKVLFIVSWLNSKQFVLETEKETFGELKAEFEETHSVDTREATWHEGYTHTEYKNDRQQLLPAASKSINTDYDMVFRLSPSRKKYESGAASRAELIEAVKKMGIAALIKEETGKNFTNCNSSLLQDYVDRITKPTSQVDSKEVKPKECKCGGIKCKEKVSFDVKEAFLEVEKLLRPKHNTNHLREILGLDAVDHFVDPSLVDKIFS